MPPTPIDNLIDAGPTDGNTIIREMEHESTDDFAIPVDSFKKAKEGETNVLPLDPKTKALLEKEEKAADEKDKLEKANEEKGDDSNSELAEKQGTEKVDSKPTTEPKDKEITEQKESDDSLIHLELAITPRQAGFFKKMDKAAKEFVISELKQRQAKITELTATNKDLFEKVEKGREARKGDGSDLPDNWYENESALYITPEFNSVATKLSRVEMLKNHYRNQIIAIEEGDNWEDLAIDAKGNITKQLYKPTAEAKALVNDNILKLNNAENELKQMQGIIEQNFRQNHLRTREQVVKLEDQYFPQYKDQKALEKNEHYQVFSKLADKFGLKKDRMYGVTAKMFVFTQENFFKIQALEDEIAALKAAAGKVEKKGSNGPTGDEINHGGGKPPVGDPDDEKIPVDAFEKYKNRE